MPERLQLSDEEWRARLTEEQYRITRQAGTEAPGSGELLHTTERGDYRCVCCGATLFRSDTKFDAGCGWPSFTDPANREHVTFLDDTSHGMRRTEVRCASCDAHLGHVFPDGPGESGERFCINSLALAFAPAGDAAGGTG